MLRCWIIFVFLFFDGVGAGDCNKDMKKHYMTILKLFMFYLMQLYINV